MFHKNLQWIKLEAMLTFTCYDTSFLDTSFLLDIFNSCANKKLIINFSKSYKQFERLKCFPNLCLHKGKALENLVQKKCLYIFLCFVFLIFIYVVTTINYSCRKWFKQCKPVTPLFYSGISSPKVDQITSSREIIIYTNICQLNTSKSFL